MVNVVCRIRVSREGYRYNMIISICRSMVSREGVSCEGKKTFIYALRIAFFGEVTRVLIDWLAGLDWVHFRDLTASILFDQFLQFVGLHKQFF